MREPRHSFRPLQGKGTKKAPGMVPPGATNLRKKKFGKKAPRRLMKPPQKSARVNLGAVLDHLDPTNRKGGGRSL